MWMRHYYFIVSDSNTPSPACFVTCTRWIPNLSFGPQKIPKHPPRTLLPLILTTFFGNTVLKTAHIVLSKRFPTIQLIASEILKCICTSLVLESLHIVQLPDLISHSRNNLPLMFCLMSENSIKCKS